MITLAAASRLYHSYLAIDANAKPGDRKVALAAFLASTQMVHAFGIGNTPFHVEMIVHDVVREAGARPPWGGISNDVQHAHDDIAVAHLFAALVDLS